MKKVRHEGEDNRQNTWERHEAHSSCEQHQWLLEQWKNNSSSYDKNCHKNKEVMVQNW